MPSTSESASEPTPESKVHTVPAHAVASVHSSVPSRHQVEQPNGLKRIDALSVADIPKHSQACYTHQTAIEEIGEAVQRSQRTVRRTLQQIRESLEGRLGDTIG